jgi:hypothetical protein
MRSRSVPDRPMQIALIGFAGVVVAAVIGAAATYFANRPETPVPSQPTGTPTASPPTSTADPPTPEPTDAVQNLLSHLPESVSGCIPDSPSLGALARVECTSTPGTGSLTASLVFQLYDGLQPSRQAFNEAVPAAVAVSERVCPAGPDRSDYRVADGGPPAGLLACWVAADTAPYIVWTRDDPGIMAIASGPAGSSLDELWVVWTATRIGSEGVPSAEPDR